MRICVADLESNGFLENATVCWCGVFKDINSKEIFEFRPNEIDKMLSFIWAVIINTVFSTC